MRGCCKVIPGLTVAFPLGELGNGGQHVSEHAKVVAAQLLLACLPLLAARKEWQVHLLCIPPSCACAQRCDACTAFKALERR